MKKHECIQIIFYSKYPVVLLMLFWIFLVRWSSRSIVIFLIVSKEIQKYDQRKFYFFSEKKNFQIWYSRSSLKKKSQKNLQFFFRTPKLQNYKNCNEQNFEKKFRRKKCFEKKTRNKFLK